jgi:thiol-disulfide isomerase/thioredoxin
MRRTIAFLLSSLVLTSCVLSATAAELPRKATDFAVQTAPEKYIWLSEHEGKTVVLAFILTTCPHCQFTTGILNKLEKEYAPKGVIFLESAIEPMSSLHIPDFKKQMGVTFPVGYNEQGYASKFLGGGENDPMLMPQLVIIDGKGMIRSQFSGDDPGFARPVQEATIREAIENAMKGTAPRKVMKPAPAAPASK